MKLTRSRFLGLGLGAFAAGGALFLAACSKHETTVEAGNRTGTLHFGGYAEPTDLDPHINNSLATAWIVTALYEGLVRRSDDGKGVRPGAAESWDISADGLTYTFRLRANAQWSNGEPVTADDFVAAFRRFLEPKLGCEGVNVIFPIVGARDYLEGRNKDFSSVGIRAPDARTLEVKLQYRTPYFLGVFADDHLMPLHQPSLDQYKGRDARGGKWTEPGNLISNGPFVLKDWQPHVAIEVRKNPRYWDAERVKLNAIRYYPIEDAATEERAFRAGQLHVTYVLPYSKLGTYLQQQSPELKTFPILRTDYVSFATTKPPFNDARVRRAFSLAIDRDRLVATVLKGRGDAAGGFVRPGVGGYTFPPFLKFDADEAKKLLAEAGFPGGRGFPTIEYTLSSRAEDVLLLGQALQQMWQQTLGVKVTLAPTEHKVWLDILRNKSFAFTSDNWNMTFDDPSDMLALAVSGDPNNDCGWSNAEYDATFAAIASAPDDATRRAAIAKCEQIMAAEAPYAPIFFGTRAHLVHPSVVGWRDTPLQRIDWTAVSLKAAP
jgi:oligopeptide transport system substrate-binding protein